MYVIQFQFKKNEPGEFSLKSLSFAGLWSSDHTLTTAVKETSSLARGTGIWEGLRTRKGSVWWSMTTTALALKESNNFRPSSTTAPVTRSLSVSIYVVNNS